MDLVKKNSQPIDSKNFKSASKASWSSLAF